MKCRNSSKNKTILSWSIQHCIYLRNGHIHLLPVLLAKSPHISTDSFATVISVLTQMENIKKASATKGFILKIH